MRAPAAEAPEHAPTPAAAGAPELTLRALLAGALVGSLLAVGNVYMGLKTGWFDSGSITASILGFAVLSSSRRLRGTPSGPLENNMVQTVAASVGAAPAAAGLLGALPALALLGREPPMWVAAGFGLALSVLGVLAALLLRRRLLEEEALPFPTGTATAEVIRALHVRGGMKGRARALLGSGLAAMAFTALRDGAGLIPAVTALPGRIAGVPAAALTLGIGWNPMLLGAGLVAGARNGLSVLLGAAVAWGAVAPALVAAQLVAQPDYGQLVVWLAWPGVALILGAAATSLASQAGAFLGTLRDLSRLGSASGPSGRRDLGLGLALGGLAAAAVVGLGSAGFALPPLQAAATLALALLLASVCARAAGQTDISPNAEMGSLAQAAMGAFQPQPPAVNVAVGAIVAGGAAQTSVSLWSLRAGLLLGASPARQARGLLLGAALGSAVGVPVYWLLSRAHGIGSAALPAPAAVQFRAVAEVMARGGEALPPHAAQAAALGLLAGVLLELLGRGRLGRFLPSAGAMGMGFIAPAYFAAAICLGSLAGALARAVRPAAAEAYGPVVGAGAIAGESLMGSAIAGLLAAGLLRAP